MSDRAGTHEAPGGGSHGSQLGRFLSGWRRERGLSIRALAQLSGVNRMTIKELENGDPEANPTLQTLLRLQRALGLASIEQLLGGFAEFPSQEQARRIQ